MSLLSNANSSLLYKVFKPVVQVSTKDTVILKLDSIAMYPLNPTHVDVA